MHDDSFFNNVLSVADPLIHAQIENELLRQKNSLELIASENIVSKAVLEAQGSILTNKYAEGYPAKRYYGGCEYVDAVETLAINRAKELFDANFVNVQPHSGCQANQAVFLALLQPHDTILSLSLDCGGHLSHGASVSQSGKWFHAVHYQLDPQTFLIDYDEVERLALEYKPKLIIAGYSAYPRKIDFAKFRAIADKVGAYLMADIAHIAGLVAAKVHVNPLEHAHVVTTTTHKTLRGPRGGMIMTNDANIAKLINSAVFPGLQGGPLMHVIAGKAVAFGEALKESYKTYIRNVVVNCGALAERLMQNGCDVITGGTDNHLLIINLKKHGITGKDFSDHLENIGLTCNKNSIPFETSKPTVTSGVRLGTAACTTRGLGVADFHEIADLVMLMIQCLQNNGDIQEVSRDARARVDVLCKKYPIY